MATLESTFSTPLTELFGIKHPIMLAGMNQAAGPELAAAVSNAGGIGTVGAIGWSPSFLKGQIERLKSQLRRPDLPFGIDLLLPKVGNGARATNKDYTRYRARIINTFPSNVFQVGALFPATPAWHPFDDPPPYTTFLPSLTTTIHTIPTTTHE